MGKLGFTGTRKGMTAAQVAAVKTLIQERAPSEAHHGDAIGADSTMHDIALEARVPLIVIHPPTADIYRAFRGQLVTQEHSQVEIRPAKPYLVRDKDIVVETDELIATPKGFREEIRSGTWATIRYARFMRRRLTIVWPDGRTEEWIWRP